MNTSALVSVYVGETLVLLLEAQQKNVTQVT